MLAKCFLTQILEVSSICSNRQLAVVCHYLLFGFQHQLPYLMKEDATTKEIEQTNFSSISGKLRGRLL